MWRKKPILVQKNYKEDGDLRSILQYIDAKIRGDCFLPKWVLITASLISAFILLGLIAAVVVVSFAKPAAVYQQNCQGRSCMKGLNLKCVNNTCVCDTGYIFINNCSLKKNHSEQCHATEYCKDNVNLVCLDGVCKCAAHQYWNGSSCVVVSTDSALMYGQSCINDKHCITDAGLYCDKKRGICTCDNTTRFWDRNTCFPKRTFNETCANDTNQCMGSQYLICVNQLCVCNSTQYWDTLYLKCLNLLFENATCSSSIQCFSPMYCSSSNICQCDIYKYHNINTLACVDQKLYNGSCLVDFNCRVDMYLQCVNGYCQCLPSFPIWSGLDAFGSCIVAKTYTDFCYFTSDCDSSLNLVCSSPSNNCTCPIKSQSSYCDCQRSVNDENYWNGNLCTSAHSYGQSCINSSTNYMCQTMTQGTYCQGVTNQCKCKTNFYFSNSQSKCKAQVSYNGACPQADACRSDLGLSCQSGVCACNSSTQFWSASKCINYYSYNEGTCANDGECNGNLICRLSGTTCMCPVAITTGLCDCPSSSTVLGLEYYWNGMNCAYALDYQKTCTSSYQCKTDIKSLTCMSGKCNCANGYYDTVAAKCNICATGWYHTRGYCFKGYYCPSLTSCSAYHAGATLATNLISADSSWLIYYTNANFNFYTSAGGVWIKQNKSLGTDVTSDCASYSGIYSHGIICQYVL